MKKRIYFFKKLKKEVFKGISVFEICLFTIATITGLILFITNWFTIISDNNGKKLIANYIIALCDIPLGVIAATFLSKRHKFAPLLLIFDALLYGTSNFLASNYALGVVNAIITPLIYLWAYFFSWNKSILKNKKEIQTKKLTLISGLLSFLFLILIAILFSFILPKIFYQFDGKNKYFQDWLNKFSIWFDSFAASLMLMAVISSSLRYRETWYFYFIANLLKIILFSITLAFGYHDDLLLLVISSVYFTNSIFGLIVWKDSYLIKNKKQ